LLLVSIQSFALIKSPPEKAILPNGMRVVVVEDKSLPFAAVGLMFDTQILKGTSCNSGLGNIYRSLLKNAGFKGKSRYDFNADLERVGIIPEFAGNHESFYAACQGNAEQLENMLSVLYDLGFALEPTLEDFDRAKAEALRILKNSEKYPLSTGRLANKVWQDLYPELTNDCHGPAEKSALERVDFNQIKDVAKKVFVPNKAVLVIVGDVDASRIFKISMKIFGSLQASVIEARKIADNQTVKSRKIEKIDFYDIDRTEVLIGFEAPGFACREMPAAKLWKTYFDGINDSWLESVVARDFPELEGLHASYYPGKKNGVFVIGFSTTDNDINRPVNFILSSLSTMSSTAPKGRELQRIIEMRQLKDLDRKETRIERVFELGLSELKSSYRIADGLVAAYSRVTFEEMKKVAGKMFNSGRYVVRVAYPLKMQQAEAEPVMVKELENGVRLTVRNYAGSEVVGLTLSFGIDSCSSSKKDKKMARMLAELVSVFVNDKENRQLNRRLDNLGARLEASYSNDFLALTARVQTQNLPELILLLRDLVRFPDYTERFFVKAQQKYLKRLQDEKNLVVPALNKLTLETLYPGMNIYSDSFSPEEIHKVSFSEIKKFYSSWATGRNMSVAAVGNFETERVLSLLSKAFSEIEPGNAPIISQCPLWVGQPLEKTSVKRFELPATAENAVISVAFRLKPFLIIDDKEGLKTNFGANLVMSHVLFSSRNSILAQELKKINAYRGLIGNYLSNQTHALQMFVAEVPVDRVEEAKATIERVVNNVSEMEFSRSDIVAAGQNLRSMFNRMLEKSDAQSQVLCSFLHNGVKADFLHDILSVYNQVSVEDVKKAKNNFNRYFMIIGEPAR
jgi:predicted Zn-dependent peptidase